MSVFENFMCESNAIEGITRAPTHEEISATESFLNCEIITVLDLKNLVHVYQPDAVIREHRGLNVRVGTHLAPPGGPKIPEHLRAILTRMMSDYNYTPYQAHCDYEILHPFTDGNGRSGRTLWAWHMLRRRADPFALLFLHRFYYQSLSEARHTHV